LGVATPFDLISDPNATPFNIGRAIELRGFQLHESAALAEGLVGKVSNPQAVLRAVLDWTGGQPFLTQKLCWLIANTDISMPAGSEAHRVAQLVQARIVDNWESQDEPEHLRTLRDRVLRNARSSVRLLRLYQQILRRGKIAAKDCPDHLDLRLSGLVTQQQGSLVVKNSIYKSVFNLNWATKELKALDNNSTALPAWRVLAASLAIATFVIGVRRSGMLQAFELKAFDHLMRTLPPESADQRLLIVGADEKDIGSQYSYPIPDAILAQLLDKLNQYKARVIGLDIVRDQPVSPGHEALVAHLQHNENLIAICAIDKDSSQSIVPPPQIPAAQVGFADLYADTQYDNQDYTVRRYLLSRTPNRGASSPCSTQYSFGFQLAYRYLKAKGISVKAQADNWMFGSILAKRLATRSGGYQNLDAGGNQLLLHYRNTPDPEKIAQQVTFRDVLNGSDRFDPAWVKERVVLIGVTAASIQDLHDTPSGRMRGLYVHAHLVSQILSAVEDGNRPLLWWWPWWGDALWVLFWSSAGGVIVWRLRVPLHRGLGVSTCVLVLYGLCWFGLIKGGWLPLVPSVLALVGTGGIIMLGGYFSQPRK